MRTPFRPVRGVHRVTFTPSTADPSPPHPPLSVSLPPSLSHTLAPTPAGKSEASTAYMPDTPSAYKSHASRTYTDLPPDPHPPELHLSATPKSFHGAPSPPAADSDLIAMPSEPGFVPPHLLASLDRPPESMARSVGKRKPPTWF